MVCCFTSLLCKLPPQDKAFTLSELLIGIAIIGFIATIAIPKVLGVVETQIMKTTFKETISAFQKIGISGWATGELAADGSNSVSYFASKLNAIKICTSNVGTEGCFSQPTFHVNISNYPGGAVFANGANSAFAPDYFPLFGFVIDYNGESPPNSLGRDQMFFLMNIGSTTVTHPDVPLVPYRPGEVKPHPQFCDTDCTNLYNSLWQ